MSRSGFRSSWKNWNSATNWWYNGNIIGINLDRFDFQKCHTYDYILIYILSGSHPQMAFCQIGGLLKLILNDGS